MANPTDPKVAQELADAMKSVGEYAEEATDAFEQQLKVVSQMRDAMEEVAKVMYALCQQDCKALNPDVWKNVTKEVLKKEKAVKNTTKEVKKLAQTLEKDFFKGVTIAVGALTGLIQGFKNLAALGRSFGGVVSSIIGGVWELGKSILSIPLKIMEGLFSMAAKGGSNELDTALQGLVKRYGDLGGVGSQAVVHAAKSMAQATNDGFNAYRVFGNLADRIKAVQEMTEGMGATFNVFSDEVDKNGFALARFQKGLGFTSEQMEGLAHAALRTDKDMADVATDMTKMSQEMSKAFKVPAKTISSDMAKAMKDLAHFGSLSTKELGIAATFANKLGVSVDKLTSIMDATKTYDQTAESMSKLNETYNTNIDYTKMMMLAEKGPHAQLQYLRDEFKKAGKDLSNLTYYDKLFIKSTGAMTDELINTAFATKNASVSLDKMSQAADKAEKSTMNQKDALGALVKETEKRPMEGMVGSGGIFDRFLQGISLGIERSPEFMKLMMNIRQIFRDAYWAGVKFGRMLVDTFPGVKDIISGLADLFDPGKFRKFFSDITKIFKDFSTEGGKDVKGLLDKLQENFLNFFDKESPAGQKVIQGFEKFWSVIGGILGRLAEMAINKLASFVDTLSNWIKNPQIPSGGEGILGSLMAPFQNAFNALIEKLWPAVQNLFNTLWEKVKNYLTNDPNGRNIVTGAIAVVILPSILGALTSAVAAGVFKNAVSAIFDGIASNIIKNKEGQNKVGDAVSKAMEVAKSAGEKGKAAAAGGEGATNIGKLIVNLPKAEQVKELSMWEKLGLNAGKIIANLVAFAGIVAIGLFAFSKAIDMVRNEKMEDIVKAGIVFSAVGLMMVPFGFLMQSLEKVSLKGLGVAIVSLPLLASFISVGISAALSAVKKVQESKVETGAILQTGLIATAMVPLFAGAALAAVAAGLAGKLAPSGTALAQGAVVIVAALALVGAVALGLIHYSKSMDESTVKKAQLAADVMSTVATVMMKLSLVLIAAAGIGAFAMTGLGAGAMATGVTAIGLAVEALAGSAIILLKKAAELPDDKSFETKSNIFIKMISTVGELAGKISDLIKSVDFSFFDSAKDKLDRMNSVGEIIGKLSTAVKTIIDSIGDNAAKIKPENLKPLELLSETFRGVGSMLSGFGSAIGPFMEAAKNLPRYNDEVYKKALADLTGTITPLQTAATTLIDTVVTKASTITNPEKAAVAFKALGEMFGGIGTMISALAPKMGEMNKSVEGGKAEAKSFNKEAFDSWLKGSKEMLETVNNQMGPFMDKIMASAKNLGSLSGDQIKGISNVAEVIKAMAQMISALSGSASETVSKYEQGTNTEGKTVSLLKETVQKQAPNIKDLLNTIIKDAPELFTKLTVVAGQAAKVDVKSVKKVGEIFEIIGTIVSTIGRATSSVEWKEAASHMSKEQQAKHGPIQEMGNQMGFIWNVLQLLDGRGQAVLQKNLPGLKDITTILGKIGSVGKGTLEGSKSIGDLFSNISAITKGISDSSMGAIDLGAADTKVAELGRSLYFAYWAVAKLLTGVDKDGNSLGLDKDGKIPVGVKGGPGSLVSIAEAVNSANSALTEKGLNTGTISGMGKAISGMLGSISEMLTKIVSVGVNVDVGASLGKIKDAVDAIPTKLGEIATSLSSQAARPVVIQETALRNTLAAVKTLSQLTADINKEINKMGTIVVPAALDEIAGGLGKKAEYKIQAGEKIVMNIELHVTMDAGKVEKAIVNREASILRDRINYVMEQIPIKEASTETSAFLKASGAHASKVAKDQHT